MIGMISTIGTTAPPHDLGCSVATLRPPVARGARLLLLVHLCWLPSVATLAAMAVMPGCSQPESAVVTTHLAIGGMVCVSCSEALTHALGRVPGVEAVTVDHVAGTAEVRHRLHKASPEVLVTTVTDLGYTATVTTPATTPPATPPATT